VLVLSLKDPKAIAMTARSGLNDLAGDNIVRSDLVVEPQPSRRNEKACQEKDVYWPLQQLGLLETRTALEFILVAPSR
jgi:hypothetical protein